MQVASPSSLPLQRCSGEALRAPSNTLEALQTLSAAPWRSRPRSTISEAPHSQLSFTSPMPSQRTQVLSNQPHTKTRPSLCCSRHKDTATGTACGRANITDGAAAASCGHETIWSCCSPTTSCSWCNLELWQGNRGTQRQRAPWQTMSRSFYSCSTDTLEDKGAPHVSTDTRLASLKGAAVAKRAG